MSGVRRLSTMSADLARARRGGAFGPDVRDAAAEILEDVKREGDAAVLRIVRRFDDPRARVADLLVDAPALRRAARRISPELRLALDLAYHRIRTFHEAQRPRAVVRSDRDALTRLVATPLARVGALVPRGTAGYPSTVLMTGIPAQVAGVPELVVASPMTADGDVDPALAYALTLVDAQALYRAGGAAAVGALAYGTRRVDRVDKIVGPGNAYAAAAKWLVSADVGIDALQGPSELVVVASADADPDGLRLDLLAQAEHGSGAFAALVSSSITVLRSVNAALREDQDADRVFLYHAPSLRLALRAANDAAPEHLLLAGREAARSANAIDRAGAVFIGMRSAVAFGDYVAGTNHCLPTGGTARWASALRVDDFMRWTSRIEIRRPARLAQAGAAIARHERMRSHADSMEVRG